MDSRYARQVILPQIGSEGQARLASARVAVAGAGGLGSPVIYYLAAVGVGELKIIDADTVDITNLNRQILHFENDIGKNKAQSAKDKLGRFNKDVHTVASAEFLDNKNAAELLSGYDIVMSCVDNNETRYALNSACIVNRVPLVNSGVQGFDGYIMVVQPGITPCYNCIFPGSRDSRANGESPGIIGAAAGVLGSMMAVEAIKVIVGMTIDPSFYYVDLLSMQITPVAALRSPDCSVCSSL